MTNLSDIIEQNKRLAATLVSPPARPRLTSPSVTGRDFSGGGGGGGGEKKDKGILGGIASIIPSAVGAIGRGVSAIPQFAGKLGQTAIGFGEGVIDLGADLINENLYKSRFETDLEKGRELGLEGDALTAYAAQRQYPLAQMVIESTMGTGRRVAEVVTGGAYDYGDPGIDYARAFREGNLGALLVEDVGNVILAGRATGAGNVVGRAGTAIGETAPRLGRAVSTAGRVIEEPVGETVRQAGRLVGAGAQRAGMTGLSDAARRVYYDIDAQAPTSRPIRVLVNQVGEKYRSMNEAAANELFRQAADLSDQAVALRDTDPMRSSQLQAEADIALQKAQDKVVGTGVVRAGRKIAYRMALASERSTQRLVNEFRRVDQYGSVPDSVANLRKYADQARKAARKEGVEPARAQQLEATAVEFERRAAIKERYPEYFDQQLQPWVAGAATLLHIGLGRYARVLSERGFSDQDIAIAFQRPDIIPTLENKAMKVTPEMVKAAREYDAYQRGNMQAMNEGAALAVQGYLELVQAAAESFSDAVRRGFGIPTGALPASFFSFFPEPTFLLGAINTWPTEIQAAASRLLDYVVAETLIEMVRANVMQLDDLKELGIDPAQFQRAIEEAIPEESTSNPYRGYYAKMVKAGPGSQGYEIASIAVENAYPKLRQIAPEQMMNKNIYPAATTRPAVEAAEQVVRMATADDVATMRDSLIALVNEFQNDMPKQLVEGALRDIEKSFQPGVAVTKTAYVRMEKRLATILANAERTLAKIRSGEMKVVGELDQITLEFARAIDALTRAREMVRILGEEPVQVSGQTAVRQAEAEVRAAEEQLAVKEAQLRGLEEVARQEEAVYAVTQPIGRLKRVRETTTETVAEPTPEPVIEPAPAPVAEPTPVTPEAPVLAPRIAEPVAGVPAPGEPLGLRAESALPPGKSFTPELPLTKKELATFAQRGLKSDQRLSFITNYGGRDFIANGYQIIAVSELPKGTTAESLVLPSDNPPPNITRLLDEAKSFNPVEIVGYVQDARPDAIPVIVILRSADGQLVEVDATRIALFLGKDDIRYASGSGTRKTVAVYKGDKLVGIAMSLRDSGITLDDLRKGGDPRLVAPATNPLAVELHRRGLWLLGKGQGGTNTIVVGGLGSAVPVELQYATIKSITGLDPKEFLSDLPYATGKYAQPYEIPRELRQQFDAENLQTALENDRQRGKDRTDAAKTADLAAMRASLEGKNPKDTLSTRASIAVIETLDSNPTSPKYIVAPATKSAAVRVSDTYDPGTVYIIENGRAIEVRPDAVRGDDLHRTTDVRRLEADRIGRQRLLQAIQEGLPEPAVAPTPTLRPVERPALTPAPTPVLETPTPRPAPEPTLRTVTRTTTRMKPVTEPPARFPAGREVARRLSQAKDEVRKAQSEVTAARRMLTKATERVGKQQRQEVTARLKGVGYLKEGKPVLRKDVERRLEDTTEQLANKEANRNAKLQDLKEQEARAEGYATAAEAEATIARQRDEATGPDNPIGPELFDPETDVIGYFPMGPTRGMLPKSEIQTQLLGEGMGAQNEPSFVRIRRGGGFVLTAADTANKFSEIMKQMFHNEAVETVLRDPNITKSAVAELGEGWFALNEEAARQAVLRQEANRLRTPDEIDRAVKTELGVMAIRELRRRGYEPVSPAKIDPETGGHAAVGTLDRVVTPADMDQNTIIMRIGVKERLSSDYVKKGARNVPTVIEKILDKVQRGTSRWKSVILPLSLRWQIGDAVSNVMNAWLRGGISPAELQRYVVEVTRRLTDPNDASIANLLFGDLLDQAMRDPVMSAVFGSGLEGRGQRLQEVLFTGRNADRILGTIADPRARTIAGQYFNQFRAKAFRLNEAHNSIVRAAVALKNLEDNLAKVGRTVDEINGVSALKDPVIQKAIEDSVSTTNDILGAFSDLTPWEKSVMRQIFPFWSWVKFINRAAMEIAIDSPDRVLFYAHLGSMASDPDQNGFLDFLRGKTPVGPWLMDLSFMNPYSDAIIFEGNPLSATAEQFTSFSPAITVPLRMLGEAAYGATGREFPFLPVSSRPGYLEGRPGATTRSLGDVLGGMAYIGLKGVGGPFRNVLEVLPTGTIPGTDIATGPGPRFPQGSLRTTGAYAEPRLSGITERVSSVLRTFGIPGPIAEVDIARRQAEEQAQRDEAAKKRREKERANK